MQDGPFVDSGGLQFVFWHHLGTQGQHLQEGRRGEHETMIHEITGMEEINKLTGDLAQSYPPHAMTEEEKDMGKLVCS